MVTLERFHIHPETSATGLIRSRLAALSARAFCFLILGTLTTATIGYAGRGSVNGVKNFGRVTDGIYRGGDVTTRGLENLHDMGVRIVIDLAGDDENERRTCRRLGITHYRFPMDSDERPNDRTVARILQILREADQPVYLHCSAGKHRAGTLTALYRIRVQGWSAAEAWAEQQSYGFGSPGEHRVLYEYVYGRGSAPRSKYRDRD